MGNKSIYIRVALEKPLEKFAEDNKTTEGVAINDMIELALRKEGYLDE